METSRISGNNHSLKRIDFYVPGDGKVHNFPKLFWKIFGHFTLVNTINGKTSSNTAKYIQLIILSLMFFSLNVGWVNLFLSWPPTWQYVRFFYPIPIGPQTKSFCWELHFFDDNRWLFFRCCFITSFRNPNWKLWVNDRKESCWMVVPMSVSVPF